MIKYSVQRVINSNINLPCHQLNHEKWKLRESKRGEKVTAQQCEDLRAESRAASLSSRPKVTGGSPSFSSPSITSLGQWPGGERREGAKWQMKGMKRRKLGNTRREVQQNEKEGRKGKQAELLMLAIRILPGSSVSKGLL